MVEIDGDKIKSGVVEGGPVHEIGQKDQWSKRGRGPVCVTIRPIERLHVVPRVSKERVYRSRQRMRGLLTRKSTKLTMVWDRGITFVSESLL